MIEELNTNPTAPAADTPVTPVEAPIEAPAVPAPSAAPIPEPIAPAPTTADKPVEPTSTVAEAMVDKPPPSPAPVPETGNTIQRLLAKAKEKIQFRKQAKLEKIMVFAKAQGGITNDQAQKLLRVSDATATRYLAQLVKTGRLRLVKAVGRGARYAPAQ